MCLDSVKSNTRISAGKVGKDSGRCRVPVGAEPISQLTDVPALISHCTAPFPLCCLWLSFGSWVSKVDPLNAPSCLWEEEEGVDANRGLQSPSPELKGGDRDAVTK